MAKIGLYAKAIRFGKGSLLLKNKNSKKDAKNDSRTSLKLLCEKNGFKNTQYSKNDKFLNIAKIGHYAKAIGFAKASLWLKN